MVPLRARRRTFDHELTLLLFESPKYGDGRGANKAWLQELPDTLTTVMWSGWAEIASRDAERLGVATGDRVELASAAGSIEVPAVVRPEARPGTIALPLGPRPSRTTGATRAGAAATRSIWSAPTTSKAPPRPCSRACACECSAPVRRSSRIYGRGLREAEHIPTGWAPMKKDHS